jgi:DNA polymerase
MKTLAIDIETYSSTDLLKSGVYKYVQAADFTILLFAYSIDSGPVEVVDFASGERLSENVLIALTSPYVLKTAYNANFERTCISQHFQTTLPVEQWTCSMALVSMLGLPLSLDAAAKALKIEAQKSAAGKALIKYFSVPCKPTKVNGGRTRNLPEHAPEKWNEFKEYCRQDVVVEQAIRNRVSFFTPPPTEKILWQLDQTINDTGVMVDRQLIQNAIRIDRVYKEKLTKEAVSLTGLDNPNSVAQLKQWIGNETGLEVGLKKTDIPDLLKNIDCKVVKRVLELRQEMSKTSVKKYAAMMNGICSDDRLRGIHQYYGANRTGRWAGRLVQPQNLPRNEMSDLDLARQLVRSGDLEMLEIMFDSVPDTLSQLIRTAFVAPEGSRFIPADFSAIEARVIAWLAGEKWRLDVFKTHGKIYEASAAQMFKVPIESVTKGSPLRQRGKIAELALGYQGGPNALESMEISNKVPEAQRIPADEKPKVVAMWRNANKAIVRLWNTVGDAALNCVADSAAITMAHGIRFFIEKGILFIQLPSGRKLSCLRPKIRDGKFGPALYYEGMDQTTKQWGLQQTYGGKLVENIVQAVARDVLADSMIRLRDAGYQIVMHVHDENVLEMPYGEGSVEEVNRIMSTEIPWAKGLPLAADSYETEYYKKD